MKVSRFSEQQIALLLKQVDDGVSVEEVCRKAGISQQTYYRWRKKYGGLMPSEVRRLKQLEEENRRLKQMVAAKVRSDRKPPSVPNEVWAMDFLSDQLFDGRKIRILTIVDAFSKLSPAIDVRFCYTGADVVATLNRVTGIYGVPQTIRVDNGPEFVSRALDLWAYQNGVVLDFSRPGKPTDNSFVEAFNGKVRAECIDQNWFLSLADARLKCEAFRHEYNGERPHSSIGHKTPVEFMKSIGAPSQPMGS